MNLKQAIRLANKALALAANATRPEAILFDSTALSKVESKKLRKKYKNHTGPGLWIGTAKTVGADEKTATSTIDENRRPLMLDV